MHRTKRPAPSRRAEISRSAPWLAFVIVLLGGAPDSAYAQATPLPRVIQAGLDRLDEVFDTGDYAAAEALGRELLTTAQRDFGQESFAAAKVMDQLVVVLARARGGTDPEAGKFATNALAIKEKVLGPDHVEVAKTLNHVGYLRSSAGDYAGAETALSRAAAIYEANEGEYAENLSDTLYYLTNIALRLGQYDTAVERAKRSLEIAQATYGPSHEYTADSWNMLGRAYEGAGDYTLSQNAYERGLAVVESALGPEHETVGMHLTSVAGIHKVWGDYATARPLYERALAIRRKVLGEDHPAYANNLYNYCELLNQVGDYDAALEGVRHVLTVYQASSEGAHQRKAYANELLGGILLNLGRLEEARAALEAGMDMRLEISGRLHRGVAQDHSFLGEIAQRLGDYDTARSHLLEAATILDELFENDHPDKAAVQYRLARLYLAMGNDAAARRAAERGESIQHAVFNPRHPDLVAGALVLAQLDYRAGRPDAALKRVLDAEDIGLEHVKFASRFLPERSALQYAATLSEGRDLLLTLEAAQPSRATRDTWDAVVRGRALVLDELGERHRTALKSDDPKIKQALESLAVARRELARLLLNPEGADREAFAAAYDAKQRSETRLATLSAAFRRGQAKSNIGLDSVTAALPDDAALVAYVRYRHISAAGNANGAGTPDGDARYLAFVVRENTAPRVVALGSAATIDGRVARWRADMAAAVAAPPDARAEQIARRAGDRLRQSVWDPLGSLLEGTRQVIVVPDAALHLVDFNALPTAGERYLVEDTLVRYAAAERDLATPPVERSSDASLVAGAPAFDDGTMFAALHPKPLPGRNNATLLASTYRGTRSTCAAFSDLRFEPVPASSVEANQIAGALRREGGKVVLLEGAEADETSLKTRVTGKRFVHLATHAFFIGDRCRGAAAVSGSVAGDNPLLLSGLALAGANHRSAAGPGEDDGILTAEEIASLNLAGTELVALSACDTGLGRISNGEGVFGLRRAFTVAGARHLLMSLWPVEDRHASEWMRGFYGAYLGGGQDVASAVRSANLESLRRLREGGRPTHPVLWGGFVGSGAF
jgi:CHAT domain-containing protein